MLAKIQALKQTNTLTNVDLPINKASIGCKWVSKIKYLTDGSIDRCIAKGYTQLEGVNYSDTLSPISKLATAITLPSIASIKN